MKYISIHNKLWNKNSILHLSKKAAQFQVRIKICNIRLGKSTRGLPGRYGTIRILSECPAQPSIITFRYAGKQNLKTILFLQQVAPKATQGSFQVTAGNLQLPGEPRAAPQHLDKISFEVLGLTQTVDSNSSLYNSKINTLAVFPGVYTVSRLGPEIDIKFENKIVSRWGRSVGPHLPSRLEKRDTQKTIILPPPKWSRECYNWRNGSRRQTTPWRTMSCPAVSGTYLKCRGLPCWPQQRLTIQKTSSNLSWSL